MSRKNAYLTKLQMQKRIEHDIRLNDELAIHVQVAADAAAIAANEIFQMGPKRAPSFHRSFMQNYLEIINAMHEDAEHAFVLIDRRIQPIFGDKFVPYKERYPHVK